MGYGTAVLTATTFNDVVGSITISVIEIVAQKVDVSFSSAPEDNIYIGDSFSFSATITPENVDNPAITWDSSNPAVSTVDQSGNVVALAEGSTNISATASNGVTGVYTLNVQEKKVESVVLSEDGEFEVLIGESFFLTATITPLDATYPELTWATDNNEILLVKGDGKVTALNCGTATVSATAKNGISDTLLVKVNEIEAESIEITGETTIKIGETTPLDVVIIPNNTTDKSVVWSSSDENIATIDSDGNVTAFNVGETTITAKQKNVETSITFTVEPIVVDSIEISSTLGTKIKEGEVTYLSAVVSPKNATYPEVYWEVDDSSIATIDSNGCLEAKKSGKVTVTVSTKDGYSESLVIKVKLSDAKMIATYGGIGGVAVTTVIITIIKLRKKKAPSNQD